MLVTETIQTPGYTILLLYKIRGLRKEMCLAVQTHTVAHQLYP